MTEAQNCGTCGATLKAKASFCDLCGTSASSPSDVKCPQCGSDNPADTSFCSSCGAQTPVGHLLEKSFNLARNGMVLRLVTSLTIGLVTLTTLWSLLSIFVPENWLGGWVQVIINIGFFLFSVASVAGMIQPLTRLLSGGWAWTIGLGIWFFSVLLLRSLEMSILESILKS